jgi:ActD protein
MNDDPIYGLVAEFDDPEKLVEATRATRERGYRHYETYTPYPIPELDELVPAWNPVPPMVLAGGIAGTATAWGMQFYIAAIDYPINVGGRPLNSWPSFVPIMFELTVLFASIAAFFGALWLCGLPWLHHPIFHVPQIARASKDRFFLCIEAGPAGLDLQNVTSFLESLAPLSITQVEDE